jgi:hypothetical protein
MPPTVSPFIQLEKLPEVHGKEGGMLKSLAGIVAGTALLLAAGAHPARAMTDTVVIKAHIPFAFQVEGQKMPAGDYVLTPAGINELSLLKVENVEGGSTALFLTLPQAIATSSGHAEMVFDHIGNQRFLRSIRLPGKTGEDIPVVRAEVHARESSPSVTRPASQG